MSGYYFTQGNLTVRKTRVPGLTNKFLFLLGKLPLAWLAPTLQVGVSGLWEYSLENFFHCLRFYSRISKKHPHHDRKWVYLCGGGGVRFRNGLSLCPFLSL